MASKNVLSEAINKLVKANTILREKMTKTSKQSEIDKYQKDITKNETMILDYKFRLENDLY